MSIVIRTDVFCDICSDWIGEVSGPKPNRKIALLRAKKVGWKHKDGKDFCPSCIAKTGGHA